jgi:hypothetical protein
MSEVSDCEDYQTLEHIKGNFISEKGSHPEDLLAHKMNHTIFVTV